MNLDLLLRRLRENRRDRMALALIIGILALSQVLDLLDQERAALVDYKKTMLKVKSLSAGAEVAPWVNQERALNALNLEVEARTWQDASYALAEAHMQDWLEKQMLAAGVSGLNIVMAEDQSRDNEVPGYWRVGAKVEFKFTVDTLQQALARLSMGKPMLVIDGLTIQRSNSKVTLVVNTLVRKAPAVQENGKNT